MKKVVKLSALFFVIIIFTFCSLNGQNLVPNPSFENFATCPVTYNQVALSTGWNPSFESNVSPHHTEYLHTCNSGGFSVPSNVWGNQAASSGQGYMAMAMVSTSTAQNYRENIYCQLLNPLVPGRSYSASFKVSSCDDVQVATNRMGLKFSTTQTFRINNIAQISSSAVITDKSGWVTVSGTFTADSAYTFMAIGNFFTDANTDIQITCSGCPLAHGTYYLDDIEVLEIPCNVTAAFSANTGCTGTPVSFSNSSLNATSYSWDFGDGNTSTSEDPAHTYLAAGLYNVRLISSGVCGSDTVTTQLQINQTEVIVVTGIDSICLGESEILSASGGSSYVWSPVDGLSQSAGNSVSASPLQSTTYIVSSGSTTCPGTAMFTLNVLSNPIVNSNSGNICPGGNIQLAAASADQYYWSPSLGLSSTNLSSVTASPSATTTYTVVGTNTFGCSDTSISIVTVSASLPITVNSPSVCVGDTVALTASGAMTYTWGPSSGLSSNSGSTVFASPSNTFTYTVTGTSGQCSGVSFSTVSILPKPVASFDLITSLNCSLTCITSSNNSFIIGDSISSWSWNFGNGFSFTEQTPSSVCYSENGVYPVTLAITSASGCTDSMVKFQQVQLPSIDSLLIVASFEGCYEGFRFKSNIPLTSYNWNFNDGVTSTSPNPLHTFNLQGTYSVSLSGLDTNGCERFSIHTIETSASGVPTIPNVFTPNGDGMNDLLLIKELDSCDFKSLNIFNRWGINVFSTSYLRQWWDGRHNAGTQAPSGTYYYILELSTRRFTGFFQLVR